jgi:hypothetical protein
LNSSTNYDVYLRANCGLNPGDDDSLWVGPINFTTLVSCPVPTNLSSTNITLNSVDLSWTAGNTETAWEIEYGLTGFTQGSGTLMQLNSNIQTLTGLVYNTNYDVYLRANCGLNLGDDDSSWIGPITFKTLGIVIPSNLTAEIDQTTGEVTLNWSENSGFYEDFTDGVANNWIPVTGDWNVSNSTYNVTRTTHDTSTSYYNQDFSNFEFEMRAKKDGGNECNISMYFNGDPSSIAVEGGWNNTYNLMYCTNGSWKLVKIINGNWTNIVDWTSSSAINTGNNWNVLKVVYVDGYINVYINNVLLGSYYDVTFPSGKVGVKMYDNANNDIDLGNFDYISLIDLSNTTNSYTFNVEEPNSRNIYSFGDCNNEETCSNNNEIIDIETTPIPKYGNSYTYKNNIIQAFQNYKIYRDGIEIGTSIPETYLDQLPSYGDYEYYVTAIYDEGESLPSNTVIVNWHGTPNIVVTPLALSQTLYTNQTATQTVSITNNGTDDLNFSINSFVVSATNFQNIGFGNIDTENITPFNSENSLESSIVTPTFAERVYFNTSDALNILIFEYTSEETYYEDALINLGFTFTQVSYWSILESTINNGTNWDLVIINSYDEATPSNTLNILDNYQANGGKLIFADWGILNVASNNLFANMGVNIINSFNTPINFTAVNNSHTIFTTPNTVNTFNYTDNQYNIDGQIVNVINGATQLAVFDGYPNSGATVLNANQNTIFNAFQADNYHGDDNANGKPDMVELIENQINFLIDNENWLSTTQTSGTVFAGSSVIIDVNFDSTDMTVGTYNGIVKISSNDPDEPIVDVIAELIIIEDTSSINDLVQFNFKYHPNPFENSINLSANEKFTSVKIYSLLGQELMEINPDNQSQLTIDMSDLSIGTYFMKVVINDKSSSMKIIKK